MKSLLHFSVFLSKKSSVMLFSGDGCITFAEFMKARIHDTLKFSWALFNHFDHNDDDCLESWDQIQEFNEIDLSRELIKSTH